METSGAEAKGDGVVPSFGDAKDAVGDLVGGDGFALGMAGDNLRPSQMDDLSGSPTRSTGVSSPGRGGFERDSSYDAQEKVPSSGAGVVSSRTASEFKGEVPEDKEEAFALYKRTKGKSENLALLGLKADVKSLKGKAKILASECNDYKQEIDRLSSAIASKKEKKLTQMQPGGYADDVDVVDEEEFELMKSQRDAKKGYKVGMSELTNLKARIGRMQDDVDDMKYSLLSAFDHWHGISLGTVIDDGGGGGRDSETGEIMDDAEMFEKMEMERIAKDNPESIAFFQAQKTRRANQTQNSLTIRQMGRNKRSVGV